MEVSGQLHAQAVLSPGNSPRIPFYVRLGEPSAGLDVMNIRKCLAPYENRAPVVNPLATPTELSRLPAKKKDKLTNMAEDRRLERQAEDEFMTKTECLRRVKIYQTTPRHTMQDTIL
jgi:hypothetical protein